MWTLVVLFGAVAMGQTKGQAPPPVDIERLGRLLEAHPAENLPAAQAILEQWCKAEPNDASLQVLRQRMTALHTLRDEIVRQLHSAGQAAVGQLVTSLLDGRDAPNAAATVPATRAVVPAEQLYRHYLPHFRYAFDSRGLRPDRRAFIKVLYNAEVRVAISETMRIGRSLATARDTKSFEVEYYLLLLPLLHDRTEFSVASLRELPSWMLAPEHMRRLADFCLFRVGRLDAAEAIALNLRDQEPTRDARLAFRLEAADRCAAGHQSGMAVDCLKAAMSLLEPRDGRVVGIRFRVCTVWAQAKNWALAAGEAGRLAHDFAGSAHGAEALVTRLKYLAAQGDAQAILQEIDDAIGNPLCGARLPELLQHKWKALRQVGRGQEAGIILKQFLDRYPKDPAGAEMYFAVARDSLSAQRYDEATTILESLKSRYPRSSDALQADQLIERLYQMRTKVASRPATEPGAS